MKTRLAALLISTGIVIPVMGHGKPTLTSQWVASLIGATLKERDRLVTEKKPVRTAFGARHLVTGESISIAEASAFSFSADG
ncbi:hypothetical protein [Gemmatimonas sp.]|uniref:hypothetical protein n=1 Tax=Gemmatimonas sp. TaxID=1962908 RepID=UPI003983C2CE